MICLENIPFTLKFSVISLFCNILPLPAFVKVFLGGSGGKEPACQCRRHKRCRFSPWVGKFIWRREWWPTLVFLLGEFHGQRSLVGYSPQDCKRVGHNWATNTHTHAHSLCAWDYYNILSQLYFSFLKKEWNWKIGLEEINLLSSQASESLGPR